MSKGMGNVLVACRGSLQLAKSGERRRENLNYNNIRPVFRY